MSTLTDNTQPRKLRASEVMAALEVIQRAEARGFSFFIHDRTHFGVTPEPDDTRLRQDILNHKTMIAVLVYAREQIQRERHDG